MKKTYGRFGFNVLCPGNVLLPKGAPPGWQSRHITVGEKTVIASTRKAVHMTNQARKDAQNIWMRNWHPGPLHNQLASDQMAYNYMRSLRMAIDKIDKEGGPMSSSAQKRWPRKPKRLVHLGLPAQIGCVFPELCNVDEAPGCVNFERPTFGQAQIFITPMNDEFNPHTSRYGADSERLPWKFWQAGENTKMTPKVERGQPGCAHADKCAGMLYELQKGEPKLPQFLVFRLPKMEAGFIKVCGYQGWKTMMDHAKFYLGNYEVPKDSPKCTSADRKERQKCADVDLWIAGSHTGKKCIVVQRIWPNGVSMNDIAPTGHIFLGIELVNFTKTAPIITHVITV